MRFQPTPDGRGSGEISRSSEAGYLMIASSHPSPVRRPLTHRVARALTLLLACSFALPLAAQATSADAPADGRAQAYAAVQGPLAAIQIEYDALRAAHPDLFLRAEARRDAPAVQDDAIGAYQQAAYELAESRMRVLLALPDEATLLDITGQEALERYTTWRDAIVDEASAIVASPAAAPAPGLALEDLLASRLPAYQVAAQAHASLRLAATTPWDDPQLDAGILVETMSLLEAQRVSWQHPLEVSARADTGLSRLAMADVRSMRANGSFVGPQVAPLARDASELAQHAMMTGDPLAALAYSILAERAHVASTAWMRSEGDEGLLMDQLLSEVEGIKGESASLMSTSAIAFSMHAVSSIAADEAAPNAAVRGLADAVGHMAAVRMVRGLPEPVVHGAAKEAVGFAVPSGLMVLAACALCATWARRT